MLSLLAAGARHGFWGDLSCSMKIIIYHCLDDHDSSFAGAQSQAVLLLLQQSKVSPVWPQVSADSAGVAPGDDGV